MSILLAIHGGAGTLARSTRRPEDDAACRGSDATDVAPARRESADGDGRARTARGTGDATVLIVISGACWARVAFAVGAIEVRREDRSHVQV